VSGVSSGTTHLRLEKKKKGGGQNVGR